MMNFKVALVDTRLKPIQMKEFSFDLPPHQETLSLKETLLKVGFNDVEINQLFSEKGLIGVFGIVLLEDSPIYSGDRIELYTPILIDPKYSRRKKANQNKDAELKAKAKQKSEEKALRET
jgi:putative ubiquitin-RnfH superfamily antitoxin RatB of RatAB toxin-antitoxin module